MTKKAYEQFLDLPIGTFFTYTNKGWGMEDSFVKVDEKTFRRTYDSVVWLAEVDIKGKTMMYNGKRLTIAKGWSGIRVIDELPESLGYITQKEAEKRREADHKRLEAYIEEYGEYPDQGFW